VFAIWSEGSASNRKQREARFERAIIIFRASKGVRSRKMHDPRLQAVGKCKAHQLRQGPEGRRKSKAKCNPVDSSPPHSAFIIHHSAFPLLSPFDLFAPNRENTISAE
jgi:hypothetical protein